jgi:hypothetical protein
LEELLAEVINGMFLIPVFMSLPQHATHGFFKDSEIHDQWLVRYGCHQNRWAQQILLDHLKGFLAICIPYLGCILSE